MNYKNISLRELIEFGNENPQYTVGDLLFSVLQPVALANGKSSLAWLRDISDEQMFTFIDKAKELLGYVPRYDLAEGLEKTINWYRGVLND